MKYKTTIKNQYGVTLIELMIAVIISLMITAAIVYLFSTMVGSYHVQGNIIKLQEDARFMTDAITKELRMSDYGGCRGIGSIDSSGEDAIKQKFLLDNSLAWDNSSKLKTIRGYKCSGDNSDTCGYKNNTTALSSIDSDQKFETKQGMDSIIIRRMSEKTSSVIAFQKITPSIGDKTYKITTNGKFNTTGNISDFSNGDIIIISDCDKLAIGKINTVNSIQTEIIIKPTAANFDDTLSFEAGAMIAKLKSSLFYVNENGRLVKRTIKSGSFTKDEDVEIQENIIIDGFSIDYGIDKSDPADQVPDKIIKADQIEENDWEKVVMLRINLSMSAEKGGPHEVARAYSTTVNLRNMHIKK